jgi:hypothetical protein
LMFCVAFGLSMDYEVFLLSRIKEEHDNGADNVASVAVGLERTGRLVTALAGLIAIIFLAQVSSSITFIKLFGLGLAMAVLMDATLIRGTLVPAFMRLAGNANWWAPGPLRRFHDRYGVSELAAPDPATTATTAGTAGTAVGAEIDLRPLYTERYVNRVLEAAARCRDDAELDRLLDEEGLSRSQLEHWRVLSVRGDLVDR